MDSHDLNKLPLGSDVFDVNVYQPCTATEKQTDNWKWGANADETIVATITVGPPRRYSSGDGLIGVLRMAAIAHDCVFFFFLPRVGSDLLQRLNPKEHNKDEPSAIMRAAAYQRISAAASRSAA